MTAQNEEKMICEHGHYAPSCQKCETSNTYSGKAEELFLKVGASDLLIYAKQMERELVESQKREAELLATNHAQEVVMQNQQKTIEDLRTRLSGQTTPSNDRECALTNEAHKLGYNLAVKELQAEMDELKRKLAEQQALIKEMEKQVVCDHDWHEQDDSFGHEFGTEIIIYDLCEKCGATKQCDEVDYDDL